MQSENSINVSVKCSSSTFNFKTSSEKNKNFNSFPVAQPPANIPIPTPSSSVKRKYTQWRAQDKKSEKNNTTSYHWHRGRRIKEKYEESINDLKLHENEVNVLLKEKEEEIEQIVSKHIDKMGKFQKITYQQFCRRQIKEKPSESI